MMHPMSLFGLLIAGVFLVGLTLRVAADSYVVHAVVGADKLRSGAVISYPEDNQTHATRRITVSGQCPDESYIKLTRNSRFSGAAICQDNYFHIVTDLSDGRNQLQAQAYNVTNTPGPSTPVIQADYTPPAGSAADAPGHTDFLLASDYHFTSVMATQPFSWNLQHQFGVAPYSVRINWGDGQESSMTIPRDETVRIEHRYTDRGYYPISVTSTDARRHTVSLQLAAFIRTPGETATRGNVIGPVANSRQTQSTQESTWLRYVWSTYAVVAIMVLSFWLGEQREYLMLMKHSRMQKRLRHS